MSKILSGLMQKMHLQDDEYQEEFDDSAEYDEDDVVELTFGAAQIFETNILSYKNRSFC